MTNNNEINPIATFGDLVTVTGYGKRVFLVESFTVEYLHEPDGVTANIVYDLTCPFVIEYVLGDQTDITVVCKDEASSMYLANMTPYVPDAPADYMKGVDYAELALQIITPDDIKPKPKRKTPRQKQAEIDGLLDELLTLKTVVDMCGSDEEYTEKIAEVKRQLKEASA